jgi:hypothetical protein
MVDNVNDIQLDKISNCNKILLHGFINGKSTLIDLLRKLNIYIDYYSENYNNNELFNIVTGNVINYKCIINTNNPMTKFKFIRINNINTDTRDLLVSDKNTLSALLNFLLDGYRKNI